MMTETLDAALRYHGLGWSIIPLAHKDTKPRVTWRPFQTNRPDEAQLREWFGNGCLSNMAVVLGRVSGGLACRDFDAPGSYEAWAAAHPDLARRLPTVKTARGYHVYFRADAKSSRRLDDGELGSNGGYCVLPPSVHPNGTQYQWLIAPTTDNLLDVDPATAGLLPILDTRDSFSEDAEEAEDLEAMSESSVSSASSEKLPDLSALEPLIEVAISKSLPAGAGERNRSIFTFCRWLKAIPELGDCRAAQLKPAVRRWHARAYPVIGTKPFDETWADFVHAWKRVKSPKGMLFDRAVEKARADIQTPPEAANYERPATQLLVRLCWQLQQVVGDQPFLLGQRTAAGVLGISQPAAGRLLEMLMEDGVPAILRAHTPKRATRYKYLGASWGKEGK